MAKRSSDPRVAYPEVKVQCELWVLLPPLRRGGQHSGKTRFIETQGVIGHRRPVSGPPAAVVQARDRVDIVAPFTRGNSVFGESMFYRETWGTRRSSDPRVTYPEVKVQVRNLVRVVGFVTPVAPRWSVFGESSFYRAPGGNWAQETCVGAPSSGTPRESQAKFRDGTVWVL